MAAVKEILQKSFHKKKEQDTIEGKEVYEYTRVSTKSQLDNNSSIENQQAILRTFVHKHNLKVAASFGHTNESAKDDFARPEFKKLISSVKSAKRKPFAIIVFKISRFSRTGGNAISLVNELVNKLGVHIVEASSGKSTLTPRGKNEIFSQLLAANNENLERQEIIIPFMKSFLEKGGRFGNAPLGYDHYGPRVKNSKFLRSKQQFLINKDGKLLQKAFKWKISGHYSDAQIISKMESAGLKVRPQKLSKIWRNPFYCGWSVNKLLDEPVKGSWETLISEDEYKKLLTVLENNHGGYQHSTYEADKVLGGGFLKCSCCQGNLTAYRNKLKNLVYYKCEDCKNNANAMTTPKSRSDGLNNLFEELLSGLSVSIDFQKMTLTSLTGLFESKNQNSGETRKTLKSRLDEYAGVKKELQLKLGYGKITQEIFDITYEDIQKNIETIEAELNTVAPAISNLESLIKFGLKSLQNIRQMWVSADYDNKRKLQKTIFPQGLIVDVKKRQYLTSPMNKFLSTIHSLSTNYAVKKEGNFQHFVENSLSVARRRLELPTSGL
jgi:site-specific DNA recombinase